MRSSAGLSRQLPQLTIYSVLGEIFAGPGGIAALDEKQ
jgi:hypothetical protein